MPQLKANASPSMQWCFYSSMKKANYNSTSKVNDKGIIKRPHIDLHVWDHNTARCIPYVAAADECFHWPSYCDSALWPKVPGWPRQPIHTNYKIHKFQSVLSNLLHIFHHFEMGLQPHNKLYKRKTNKQMLLNQILIDHSKENLC